MWVRRLRVLGFRNLRRQELEFGPRVTLLWGPNGAGKTNLLEALFVGLAGGSCRASRDREAVAFGEPVARVEIDVADGTEERTFLWSLGRDGERRHLLDGSPLGAERARDRPALGVFLPDRLTLVKGPPSVRRSHLDRLVGALWPARADTRGRYARALAQRNALLGRIRARLAPADSLGAWDAELAERRAADLDRGYTAHGPHLDEVALDLDGRALRRYGSQGEQRTALLALLFAERRALLEARRSPPLMLLDDVMSELDPCRRDLLASRLAEGDGQTVITATEPDHVPTGRDRLEIAIRDGAAVHEVADMDVGVPSPAAFAA